MYNLKHLFFFSLLIYSCQGLTKSKPLVKHKIVKPKKSIYYCKIRPNEFFASYKGADFVNGDDIAHQLSNFVADTLGKHLKSEFINGQFKKVDFNNTIIETFKFHPDSVYYTIKMPLINVSKCDAFTCIDHRGSWISLVKKTDSDLKEFVSKISSNPNHQEEIKLFTTEFGLYEYWVQFRHPIIQEDCK
jgi:hypothetical protein